MADLAQLTAWRDALMTARYQGIRTVEYDGKRVTYATDAEMAAALGDLNHQITGTTARIAVVHIPILERALTMKNHIQNGDVITVAAPAGGIAAGEGAIIGNIFGVAAYAAAVGEPVELATTGVYQLPKATAAVLTVGARVAWDNTAKNINVPGTGRFPVGIATEAAGNGITGVAVRLDGVGTVAA